MPTSYTWGLGLPSTANNTVTAGNQQWPTIASNPDGTLYLAAWRTPQPHWDVMGRFFHGDGTPATNEFAISASGVFDEGGVSVAGLADGRFVAVYTIDRDQPERENIQARLFNADGTVAQTIDIAVGPADDIKPDVTALADGGFALSWTRQQDADGEILMSVYNADGSLRHAIDTINSNADVALDSSIVGLAGGGFVVGWAEHDATGSEVRFRRFDANGTALDGTDAQGVLIDTSGSVNSSIELAALPDGGFVVAYTDNGYGDDYDITAQVYNANGTPRSSSFRVNTANVNSDQTLPTLAVMPDGHFVVGWRDGNAQWMQVYNAVGAAVGPNSEVEPYVKNGQIAALNGSVLAHVWQSSEVSDGSGDSIQTRLIEFGRVISGTNANETLNSYGDGIWEILRGNGGHDTLNGGAGHNWFNGGAGNDTIIGGPGDDSAGYAQFLGAHQLYDFGSKIVLWGPEGLDQLFGIEHLRFADGQLDIVDDGSGLFDTPHYLSQNVDVFHAKVNALAHFNANGWHEGRDPNAFFDTSGYLAVNKDVAAAGINPLDHYHHNGWHEGRDPSASFDTTLYLIRNPDVAAAGVDPLEHFLQFGFAEGRTSHWAVGNVVNGFDAQYYLFHNPDVAAAGVDPLQHFNTFGWHEGRNPNGYFNTSGYLSHYADVAASGVNPLDHYMAFGWQEGRDPNAYFDTLGYLAANPDVAAAGVNPLEHFLQHGIYEGRQVVPDGLWH